MTFETFLWSWLKRRVHCRSLHIHVPSQRRACPDAEGKHGEASQRGIHPKNKTLQPLPLPECWEVCLFCRVLFFNHSFNRWAPVTHRVGKVHPTGRSSFQQAPVWHRQKAVSPKQALLLGQFILTFKLKWCHGQAQASTVLVGPAGHILSIYLINS